MPSHALLLRGPFSTPPPYWGGGDGEVGRSSTIRMTCNTPSKAGYGLWQLSLAKPLRLSPQAMEAADTER
jgi:hypothetical protein